MKIGICGDIHWSKYSSILRKRGNRYSIRLENLIDSINWFEDLTDRFNCDFNVYLGDFFDSPQMDAEEISALNEIEWNSTMKYFLVGNHEMGSADLFFNSANIFNLANFEVISKPTVLEKDNLAALFLPYILEEDRKEFEHYIPETFYKYPNKTKIIFSHNDLKGIQMGKFISEAGFEIEAIDKNCDRFFNGHIHNGSAITSKVINVGNLTGQNFSEDALTYDHSIIIYDTDTNECAVYTNPVALNFYKLDFSRDNDIDTINRISMKIHPNSVVTVKCKDSDLKYLKARFDPNYKDDLLPKNCNVIESRFIVVSDSDNISITNIDNVTLNTVDHLDQFKVYIEEKLGSNSIILNELEEICK